MVLTSRLETSSYVPILERLVGARNRENVDPCVALTNVALTH